MKANKKVVLSTVAVLGVAALLAGGTIAYFTDEKDATNNFKVGDVKIELYESQLHRQNSGRMGNFPGLASDPNYCDWKASSSVQTIKGDASKINGSYENAKYCTPNMGTTVGYADDITAIKNGHMTNSSRSWGYSDQQIIDDSVDYKANNGYFTTVADNVVPGQYVRKFTYVKNDNANNNNYNGSDAYILISYKMPKALAGKIVMEMPSTPYLEDARADVDETQGYFTAVKKNANGAYEKVTFANKNELKAYAGYEDGDYIVYTAVTTDPVEAGEMTYWSPINTIKLSADVQNTDPTDTDTYLAPGALYDIDVEAKAIQARTFSDAVEAINNL